MAISVLEQQAVAWVEVCVALSEHAPWWLDADGSAAQKAVSAIRKLAEPVAAHETAAGDDSALTDDQCIAVYKAVSMANVMRDVKSDERKASIVREAIANTKGTK